MDDQMKAIVPLHTMSLAEKSKYFAVPALTLGIPLEFFGGGMAGLFFAGVVGGTAAFFSEEIRGAILDRIPGYPGANRQEKLRWLLTGEQEESDEREPAGEKDEFQPPRRREYPAEVSLLPPKPGSLTFSQVLQAFTPSLEKIYLATLETGEHVFCRAEDLCHVALGGSTGLGKSVLMRLLMAQLCKAGARVVLLNPHYTRYDIEHDEDWTPYDEYLEYDAMECARYETIATILERVATVKLQERLERFRRSEPLGKPYFLVIDELPAIAAQVKKAPEYVATILREGRKVGLFLICAATDFQVKTIVPGGQSGGGVRDCYRTAFYVGGDYQTAKILLDLTAPIDESKLGKGTVMLRCKQTKKAVLAQVPYVDNKALYRLLGPSTYTPATMSRHDYEEDDLLTDLVSGKRERVTEDIPVPSPGRTYHTHVGRTAEQRRRARMEQLRSARVVVEAGQQTEEVATLKSSDNDLPPELRRAYAAFENQMSYRDLGARLGVSKDTAGKWYARLKDLGYIGEDGMKVV